MPKNARRRALWRLLALGAVAIAAALGVREYLRWVQYVWYPAEDVANVRYIHNHQGAPLCQACHASHSPALLDAPTRLCSRCHVHSHNSHPVDVKQMHATTLPLSDGLVTCHSCHNPHDTKAFEAGLRLPFNDLCAGCHPKH